MKRRFTGIILGVWLAGSALLGAAPVSVRDEADPPAALAHEVVESLLQNGVPLYQLYASGSTDHFYTTSASERDYAKSLGFVDQGIAAYVEASQIAGTLPFWRFYSGAQTDHFYTTSVSEYNYVLANGFTFEGIEGYLYSSALAGTVPLHRLSWWNPSNNDLDHFYTTSDTAKSSKLSQGWNDDGDAGYVWPASSPSASIPLYRWYASSTTDHFYTVTSYGKISGFSSQGIAAYLQSGPGPSALPFRRFYKGAPQTEHFYTTDAAEAAYVVNTLGYVEEGTGEGYLFTTPQPGTVPLYRLYWCSPTGDCDHLYTAWSTEKDQMIALGWGYDGIVGYVGMPPGSPPPPPAQDNATAGAVTIPLSMAPGQTYAASVTMTNTGGTTWTTSNNYRLGSQNPQDNVTWGLNRVDLPNDVPSGTSVRFQFNVVAPKTPGAYSFQWQMLREGVAWFGQVTSNVTVQVVRPAGDDPLLVQISGTSVTIRNLNAQTTHLYSYVLPCINSVAGDQTDLNGLPGREVIISGPCSGMTAIDDANGWVYHWQVPIARSRRILTAETDPLHPGKEVIAWTYPIDPAQSSRLYSARLSHDNTSVTVSLALLPSTATLTGVADLDGSGEASFAITNWLQQEVLHYKDAAVAPYLFRRYFLPSLNLVFFAPVDTNGNPGAEMVVGRNYTNRVGISIIDFAHQSVRDYNEYWYTISPNMVDRDGQPGAEVCFFNGSRWRMIVDRAGVIVDGIGCP